MCVCLYNHVNKLFHFLPLDSFFALAYISRILASLTAVGTPSSWRAKVKLDALFLLKADLTASPTCP